MLDKMIFKITLEIDKIKSSWHKPNEVLARRTVDWSAMHLKSQDDAIEKKTAKLKTQIEIINLVKIYCDFIDTGAMTLGEVFAEAREQIMSTNNIEGYKKSYDASSWAFGV